MTLKVRWEDQFQKLPARDQKALKWLAGSVVLFTLYMGAWQPATQFYGEALNDRERAEERLSWVKGHEQTLKALRGSESENASVDPITSKEQLASLTTKTARDYGLVLERFEVTGNNGIDVWLKEDRFEKLSGWVVFLENNYGVKASKVIIEKANDEGLVSSRLTLTIKKSA